jgi:uncharacterized protein (TIGR01777 family)
MYLPVSGSPSTEPARVLLSGASGLIGNALARLLRASGWAVFRLVRRTPGAADEIEWHPEANRVALPKDARFDAVVNLAGENIAGGRWSRARKEKILKSRLHSTRALVHALRALPQPPAVLVNASAAGYYGNRGDAVLTEESPPGEGFLADVCRGWESEATQAEDLGIRVVLLRTGTVLAVEGGALAKLLPFFRLGLGGRLGHGQQWMSWVGLEDLLEIILRALSDGRLVGAVNAVAPHPVRNVEFTRILGRVLHRPTVLPVPAFALRLVFGEMADAALLASARVEPTRLRAIGFEFRDPELAGALHRGLARKQR